MNPRTGFRIAHLGTFPPRKCGIATYTEDVVNAVHGIDTAISRRLDVAPPIVVAMRALGERIDYAEPVSYTIAQDVPEDYQRVARELNRSGVDMVHIQYEHGIFGGPCGLHLNHFLDALEIPVVATLHTTLPEPSEAMAKAIRELAKRSERLVVLNSRALPLLRDSYGVPDRYIQQQTVVIPHGAPDLDPKDRPAIRKRLNVCGETVVSTFGLLSPGKGLEHAIRAVAEVADKHPSLHYYILGQTHPGVVRESGESYRESLIALAEELGIADRIKFVNRYLCLDELCDWLQATDLYVTPYLNPHQIVSGTLAYAVAAGKPVVSTPYLHAQEILSEGRGVLTPFGDPLQLANNLGRLLDDTDYRDRIGRAAWRFGRQTTWSAIATRYIDTFAQVAQPTERHTPTSRPVSVRALRPNMGGLVPHATAS
ncbi:MAG: hypothetical protein OHK0029_01850 [Armatimonadaceae bacterium]